MPAFLGSCVKAPKPRPVASRFRRAAQLATKVLCVTTAAAGFVGAIAFSGFAPQMTPYAPSLSTLVLGGIGLAGAGGAVFAFGLPKERGTLRQRFAKTLKNAL